ncbi:hypothetical protein [Corynebacterium vitaeruminis]|uniref:ABC transporter membrane protein n=1 Tax=Corynebacterium vitaeruminis DSM 20294 TaxID=1224164 RepID=W5XXU0_9CORY|nr:hypothetical protein [Corynebacterium vitaeruminis]AHI21846.1 ABC transporter membrane protein [Corynebacterium vitaeruminis DSM 20294]
MTTETRPSVGRGLRLSSLGLIAYSFLACSIIGLAWTNLRVANPGEAPLSDLTVAVLFEVLSWACLPIFAWLFVAEFTARGGSWRFGGALLAAAVVAEVPFDLAASGRAVDVSAQNPLWAFVFCFLGAKLFGYVDSRGGQAGLLKAVIAVGVALWLVLLQVGVRFGLVYLGLFIFAFFLVFWFLRARENTMMLTAGLLGASMLIAPALGVIALHYRAPMLDKDARLHWGFLWLYPALLLIAALV